METLKHKADLLVPHHGHLLVGGFGIILSVKQIGTGSRHIQIAQNIHQRTFS